MNPALSQLKVQIKQCEEFIALCERIKQLEKFQDGSFALKQSNVETNRIEISNQLELVSAQLQRLEADLSGRERAIGAFEQQQLNELIKIARIRKSTLQLSADSATERIERLEKEQISNAQELQELYEKLEHGIVVEGLDPNTVGERLAELQREKQLLTEAMRADVTTRSTQNKGRAQQGQGRQQAPDAARPVYESDFYQGLIADFAQAKTSVEIICPSLAPPRAREIMAELAGLAAKGINVMVYTRPLDEQDPLTQTESQKLIVDAHRLLITVVQRSGIQYNAAIIDNVISWEGTIDILGISDAKADMRRTVASSHVRQLRHFIFNESG